jgi:hypothetical protein
MVAFFQEYQHRTKFLRCYAARLRSPLHAVVQTSPVKCKATPLRTGRKRNSPDPAQTCHPIFTRGFINLKTDHLSQQICDTERNMHTSLNNQDKILGVVYARMSENNQAIQSNNTMLRSISGRVEWFKELSADLKRFICSIMAGQLAVFRDLVKIRTLVQTAGFRPLD